MSQNHYQARPAAAALLKMAKAASDPAFVSGVVEAAANLKEQVGELHAPDTPKALNVETEEQVCLIWRPLQDVRMWARRGPAHRVDRRLLLRDKLTGCEMAATSYFDP